MSFNRIGFFCNSLYFILQILTYYSERGTVGVTRRQRAGVGSLRSNLRFATFELGDPGYLLTSPSPSPRLNIEIRFFLPLFQKVLERTRWVRAYYSLGPDLACDYNVTRACPQPVTYLLSLHLLSCYSGRGE